MTLSARSYNSPRLIARQENILAAAREELAEKGYDNVTMDGLAQRAGVARRTLYNNYGSKDELVITAIAEVINGYHQVGANVEPGINAIVASRRAAIRQVNAAPAYADAMAGAVFQASPEHRLIKLLVGDAIAFAREHLSIEKQRGGLKHHLAIDDLADEIVSQGWGQILLYHKGIIPLAAFGHKSLLGLLMLLESACTETRAAWISAQLTKHQANQR